MTALLLLSLIVQPAQDPGRITGTVRSIRTGAGLERVTVRLIGTDHTGVTNADGGYFLPSVAPGRYRITFERESAVAPVDWSADTLEVAVVTGLARTIDLFARPRTPGADVSVPANVSAAHPWERPARPSGRIHGRVRDAETGRGIVGADVRLLSTGVWAQTDATGRFTFRDVAPGKHHMETRMLSYATRHDTIALPAAAALDVDVRLATDPVRLEPIAVTVRSRYLQRTGYYARRDDSGSFGHYIERAEIEKRATTNLPDLFVTIPGALVEHREPGRRVIVFRRGVLCNPVMYMDGIRQRDTSILNDIPPLVVESIEVYNGGDAPLEYRTDSCGSIVVWTYHGG
jgi:hypothetical protein